MMGAAIEFLLGVYFLGIAIPQLFPEGEAKAGRACRIQAIIGVVLCLLALAHIAPVL